MPRTKKTAPTVRDQWKNLVSGASAQPLIDRVTQTRARVEEHSPLSQVQIDRVVKSLSASVSDLTSQMQHLTNRITSNAKETKLRRVWWIAGIAVGFAAAGAAAFVFTRNRLHREAEQSLVALPTPTSQNNGHHHAGEPLRGVVSRWTHRRHEPTTSADPAAATQSASATATAEQASAFLSDIAATAPFVGNVRTMVYHPSDSEHLPTDENRIYFTSEEEAIAAGYRRVE